VKRKGASANRKEGRRNRRLSHRTTIRVATEKETVEKLRTEWEKEMEEENWEGAIRIARRTTKQFPKEYFGWENLAWGLHRAGRTQSAYRILAPLLKGLKLPPPPSGRAVFFSVLFLDAGQGTGE